MHSLLAEMKPTLCRTKPSRLVVNLDASVSIPILLEETIHLPNPMSLRVGGTGIPGKFYNAEAALALLGTVRAGGASALADVDQDASDEEQTHFAHFSSRLGAGDIVSRQVGLVCFLLIGNIVCCRCRGTHFGVLLYWQHTLVT